MFVIPLTYLILAIWIYLFLKLNDEIIRSLVGLLGMIIGFDMIFNNSWIEFITTTTTTYNYTATVLTSTVSNDTISESIVNIQNWSDPYFGMIILGMSLIATYLLLEAVWEERQRDKPL